MGKFITTNLVRRRGGVTQESGTTRETLPARKLERLQVNNSLKERNYPSKEKTGNLT